MVESLNKPMIVTIMGTTGVGKSKLALDMAEKLNGEIINADSMQIYKGNGIGVMTARPSPQDEQRIPHHIYGIINAFDHEEAETFNVNKYLDIALPMIADIHSRGKLPIICGGTNYYIEALLFKKLTSLRKEETTSDIVIEKLNDKVSELIGLFKDDE